MTTMTTALDVVSRSFSRDELGHLRDDLISRLEHAAFLGTTGSDTVGSFASSKPDPGDLDLVVHVSANMRDEDVLHRLKATLTEFIEANLIVEGNLRALRRAPRIPQAPPIWQLPLDIKFSSADGSKATLIALRVSCQGERDTVQFDEMVRLLPSDK